ncbi:hypothetical protein CRG98_016213 [Punica granatum]|uniref:Uncharacterized protein n=1 Tax=Punica granatum TaxID=22663 RepID=A0A2I0K4B4_PUNGR|nr:hypothetical protein CRG98_016213 [Punica granatum]
MSGNSLNRSRGDLVGSGKPKEPLSLTPREVAESPSWLPRAMDGLLSPTQISLGSSIGPTVTVRINRFSCRPLVRLDPTPGSLSPRCLNLFIGYSEHTVYPITLDPSNLPALNLRVVKWQVATPSHVCPSHVPGKVDTPKPRCTGFAHTCPDELKFGCAQLGDSTGDPLVGTGSIPFACLHVYLSPSVHLF